MPRRFTDAELEAIATRTGEPVELYRVVTAYLMATNVEEQDAREMAAALCNTLPDLRILAKEEG